LAATRLACLRKTLSKPSLFYSILKIHESKRETGQLAGRWTRSRTCTGIYAEAMLTWLIDLSKYFDTIPHSELIKSVARHGRRDVLRLIKMWLRAPIEELTRTEPGA
jgi:hypothetical protein